MRISFPARSALTMALVALAAPGLALAHHMEGNAVPVTWTSGLLSGLAHPVIGLDHLAFLLALGLLAAVMRAGVGAAVAAVPASLAGVVVAVSTTVPPGVELAVAASLIAAGVWLVSRDEGLGAWAIPAFLAMGLAHGLAFGEAVIGAEPMPIAAYLIGLGIVEVAIVAAVCAAARWIASRGNAAMIGRISMAAGSAIAAFGIWAAATA